MNMQSHKKLLYTICGEMIVSKLPGILVVLAMFVSGGLAQQNGGTFTCTPNTWTPGASVTIEFRIDRSKYPSSCAGTSSGQPSFQSSPDGTTYTPMCTVPTDIQSSCTFVSGTSGCGCTNSNDNGFYVVEYNFDVTANTDRWWRPLIDCNDGVTGGAALTFTNNCEDFPLVTTTPTPQIITKADPEQEKAIIGLSVCLAVVLVVVMPLVMIIGYMQLKKKYTTRGSDSTNATATAESYFHKATQTGRPGDPNGPQN